ncbi:MAG TPA: helicase-related protein [Vicinamibacterales bacterium]|nr:helicase-related protein [Vicinamibacterales bacterium]
MERIRRQAAVVRYDVVTRDRRATFLAPFDRPVPASGAGRLRFASPRQALARLAHLVGRTFGDRTIASLAGADADILAHQLEPACAVIDGARRVLIADAVGLGKTIQAGIGVAEIVRRVPAARVIIVVPAPLVDQWRDELRRRFRIDCALADRAELDARARTSAPGDNPWTRSSVWIASLDYLKQPHVMAALPIRPWDLVVIDEAHTACGDSDRHETCRAIATNARRLILLTATPHDGDAARFARLVGLGALPDIDDPLVVFRRTGRDVRAQAARRVRWHRVRLSDEESRVFAALADYERVVLCAAGAVRHDAALLLLSVFRKRGLSTMGALAVSLRRRLAWLERNRDAEAVPLQRALAFDDADELGQDEQEGLTADVGIDSRQERAWIRRLAVLAEAARRHDSKAARAVALVRRFREPAIVFTEFRDSLEVLRRLLGEGTPAACLHGGQSAVERRGELARFLTGAVPVLIATDVASLGLNLHTRARAVVNLELPWNPLRLEQRAGRVDRIGQTRSVHITLLVARHEAEAPVVIRLAERALAARRAIGEPPEDATFASEAVVRACAIGGENATGSPAPQTLWSPSRRWVRPARSAARVLARQRILRRRWRAQDEDGRSGRWTLVARLPAFRRLGHAMILVFSVPLNDASGMTVESHVAGVCVTHTNGRWSSREVIDSASRLAARLVEPRCRALGRRRRRLCAIEEAREAAIAAAAGHLRRPAESQPGLFDLREARAIDERARDVESARELIAQRVKDLQDASTIDIGHPTLVVALIARP